MINKFLSTLFTVALFTTFSCSSDDDNTSSGPISVIIDGAQVTPEVGGPNQQNQVYIDLSTNTTSKVSRDSWDLGFYTGSNFRVTLNGSVAMAAAQLSSTDIDAVRSTDTEIVDLQPIVKTNSYTSDSMPFVDNPSGVITQTAIAEVSDTDENNKVYLVNLGFEVGTDTPANGAVAINGDARGWMKIRVLKNGSDYVLQYAELNAETHSEVTISKNEDFSFTFFSFNTETVVNAEPIKTGWDLNFTVFTSEVFMGPESAGPYVLTDFVRSNSKADVAAYKIDTESSNLSYDTFTLADVVNSSFVNNDQTVIGDTWRNGGGPSSLPSLKDTVFYIINDVEGNLYKLKFLALTNDSGERGHPEFVYSLLQ